MLFVAALLGFAPPAAPEPAPEPAPTADSDASRVISDGPVAVSAKLSPDPSFIGDVLQLEVVAAYPKGVTVNLPLGLSFEPLHLVGIEDAPPEATGEGLRKRFTIKLQYFDVGTGKVPGFPVTWVDESGEVHTLELPPRTFEVESLLANEADPVRRSEDPPISIEYPNTTAEIVIYAVFGTLIASLLGWIVWRRYFGKPKPVYVPPPIPAHEVALSALEELERGDLVKGGQVQEYYLQLTEIAKGYLQGRFGVPALDRTTEEIRAALLRRPREIEPLSADEVIAFLQECDLVKFARLQPPAEEADEALVQVRDMVHASMKKAAENAAEKEPDKEPEPEPEAESEPEAEASEKEGEA